VAMGCLALHSAYQVIGQARQELATETVATG